MDGATMDRGTASAASSQSRRDIPLGLDVYSSDGQLIGRTSGYLSEIPEDEAGLEWDTADEIGSDGRLRGERRLLVAGAGYITQSEIVIPESQVAVDLPGRRATLPLTLAQIREMPHHDPLAPRDLPPVS
jgi:hypothetical protein